MTNHLNPNDWTPALRSDADFHAATPGVRNYALSRCTWYAFPEYTALVPPATAAVEDVQTALVAQGLDADTIARFTAWWGAR